jgi:hypothetical protein
MPVLTNGEVVGAGQEKGFWRIETPLVEDSVDCDDEEVGEGCGEGVVGV